MKEPSVSQHLIPLSFLNQRLRAVAPEKAKVASMKRRLHSTWFCPTRQTLFKVLEAKCWEYSWEEMWYFLGRLEISKLSREKCPSATSEQETRAVGEGAKKREGRGEREIRRLNVI